MSARWRAKTNLTPSMYCGHIRLRARQIALLKVIESYNEKSVTNKDKCDQKLAEKNVHLIV